MNEWEKKWLQKKGFSKIAIYEIEVHQNNVLSKVEEQNEMKDSILDYMRERNMRKKLQEERIRSELATERLLKRMRNADGAIKA